MIFSCKHILPHSRKINACNWFVPNHGVIAERCHFKRISYPVGRRVALQLAGHQYLLLVATRIFRPWCLAQDGSTRISLALPLTQVKTANAQFQGWKGKFCMSVLGSCITCSRSLLPCSDALHFWRQTDYYLLASINIKIAELDKRVTSSVFEVAL